MHGRMQAVVVTLTTDFGTADGYVGAMKGVLALRAPGVPLIDISHEVPRHDVAHAAYVLAQATPHFPAGTIHVVVVDPGVGTERRAVVAHSGGQAFVAPDNGVLSLVAPEGSRAHAIENPEFCRDQRSATFHGRDVFAPAAAALATGRRPEEAGAAVELQYRAQQVGHAVVHVDGFGNLITNLRPGDLGNAGFTIAGHHFETLETTYAAVAPGELLAYVGSSGHVEVAVREGSAAERLGVGRGQELSL